MSASHALAESALASELGTDPGGWGCTAATGALAAAVTLAVHAWVWRATAPSTAFAMLVARSFPRIWRGRSAPGA